MLTFIGYVLLGVLEDALVGKYYLAVSARRAFLASIWSFIIALLAFFVMANALETKNWMLFLAFALGNAIGTFLVVKHERTLQRS